MNKNLSHSIAVISIIVFIFFTNEIYADSDNNTEHNATIINNEMSSETSNELVIIGASYAKDWKVKKLVGLNVVNSGIGGQQTHEVLERFQADVLDLKPKGVIVWGFINDIFRAKREDIADTVKKSEQNSIEMLNLLKSNGIRPIFASEVTITGQDTLKDKLMSIVGKILGKESYQDYVNKYVMSVNSRLKSYCKDNDIVYLGFQELLADDAGERQRKYAVPDGSHVSDLAYEKLTSYTKEALKPLFDK